MKYGPYSITYVKNFKYLEELFSDYRIDDYPMEKDTLLHFSITKNGGKINSRLLEDINSSSKYLKFLTIHSIMMINY